MAGIEYDVRQVVSRLNSLERQLNTAAVGSSSQSDAAHPVGQAITK